MAEKRVTKPKNVDMGGIAFTEVYVEIPGIEGELKINLTHRDLAGSDGALKGLINTLTENASIITMRGGFNKPVQIVKPTTGTVEPHYEPVEAAEGATNGVMHIVKVGIAIRTDARLDVLFYAIDNGFVHKYPDIKSTRTVEQAIDLFKVIGLEYTPEQINKNQELDLKFKLWWRNSDKLNSNAKPYKNIVSIEKED
jgi:hypothetical protein